MGITKWVLAIFKRTNYFKSIACVQKNSRPYVLNYYNIPAATRSIILIRLSVLFRNFFYETERKLLINGDKVFGYKNRQTSKKKTPF